MKVNTERTVYDANEAGQRLIDTGLLFMINRDVLHQFGMSMCVTVDDDNNVTDIGLVELANDPEGFVFDKDTFEEGSKKLREYLLREGCDRREARLKAVGFSVQVKP